MVVNIDYEKNKNLIAIYLVNELFKKKEKPVFLCVGSDKVLGDSVGALTGELLKAKHNINGYVYGNLDYNINAINLEKTVAHIKKLHPHSPIVLVDGILGSLDEVGQVKFYPNGAFASGEFHKGVFVGDFSILAVVDVKGIDSLSFLKSVKLKTVLKQAEFIADSIARAYTYSQNLLV